MINNEILIIDDNADIRNLISGILHDKGFNIRLAANFSQAVNEIEKKIPDVAIIDVKLDKSDNDGIDLLNKIKKIDTDVPVIMISGHANVQIAIDSLKLGAFEFIQKPFSSERLVNFVFRALENKTLKREKKILENKLFQSYDFIGKSQNIVKIRNLISKLRSTESRVFITGPAGSGKELVARQIQKKSLRFNKPFIIVNGAMLDPENYELELFGSEKKDGVINYGFLEKAKGGVLLIDEISEIPLSTQAKLLRILIDQRFKRVNGSKQINVNVRVISTSSKSIRKEIDNGNFREDLYHRLNVVSINLPPLKDRTDDIPLLLNYFSKKVSELNGIPKTNLDTNHSLYYKYDWPGNVRELRNLVERISILASNEKNIDINSIVHDALNQKKTDNVASSYDSFLAFSLKDARKKFEKDYLTSQIKKHKGNISKTANFIGMERSALHRKIKSLKIKGIN